MPLPDRLGPFEIERELGAGAHLRVRRAYCGGEELLRPTTTVQVGWESALGD